MKIKVTDRDNCRNDAELDLGGILSESDRMLLEDTMNRGDADGVIDMLAGLEMRTAPDKSIEIHAFVDEIELMARPSFEMGDE